MGWWVDQERREREAREAARRQQSELERDAAFARGLKFDGKKPLELLPSFVSARIGPPSKARAITIMDRGVFRDRFSPNGWAQFDIVDSRGVLRRSIGMPEDDVTEETVPQMWRWLDRVDPLLKVMA